MSPAPDPDSMSSCESIAEHLFLTAGGDAEADVQERTRAHLAECEPCSERLREIQRLRQVYFESAHRSADDLTADEQPDLWSGLRSKLEAEGLLRPAARPQASVAAPAIRIAAVESQASGLQVSGAGTVLKGRFGSALAGPNASRAVAGLLAGAAAGLLIFGLGGQPDGAGAEQPVGSRGTNALADAGGTVQLDRAPAGLAELTAGSERPAAAELRLQNVLDADVLNRELARISDEAWLASGQPVLRSVLPSEPDPAGYIQEPLTQPSPATVGWGNGLVGAPLRLKVH